MITREQVLKELKKVVDPELNVNIVDLGLIYGVDVNPSTLQQALRSRAHGRVAQGSGQVKVIITMTLTNPGCPD